MTDILIFFLEGYISQHDLHAALNSFKGKAGTVVTGPVERISKRQTCFLYFNLVFCQSQGVKQAQIANIATLAAARAVAGKIHIDTSVDNLYIVSDVPADSIGVYEVRLDFPERLPRELDTADIAEKVANIILRDIMGERLE